MKDNITLVIGGCRSGKSSFALKKADQIQEKQKKKYFIATSVPTDEAMEKRVEKHQNERGQDWYTIEEPVNIHEKIIQYSPKSSVILVDCLTLWSSNLLFHSYDPARIDRAIRDLKAALVQSKCPVFLVTNEVGCGIVPENKLAREFRDIAGLVNQQIAGIADKVFLMIAGIDVQIKPKH